MSFWNSNSNHTTAGPLTADDVRKMWDALSKQPPRRCDHLHSSRYIRNLREQGHTEYPCAYCGALCRV
jgi:hypothetical protein